MELKIVYYNEFHQNSFKFKKLFAHSTPPLALHSFSFLPDRVILNVS